MKKKFILIFIALSSTLFAEENSALEKTSL